MTGLQPPPVDPEAAKSAAREILAQDRYRPQQRSVLGRAWDWLLERLDFSDPSNQPLPQPRGTSGRSQDGVPVLSYVVLAVLIALALYLLVRVVRLIRRQGWSLRGAALPDEVDDVTFDAEGHAEPSDADVGELERAGRWREALVARYRSTVVALSGKGVLGTVAGTTSGELRTQLNGALPDAAEDFGDLTELFETAWYGGASLDEAAAWRARHSAERVLSVAERAAWIGRCSGRCHEGRRTVRSLKGPLLAGLVVVVIVVAIVLSSASGRRDGAPLSPNSTAPDGARALVELLDRFDVELNVRVGMPAETDGAALLLESEFDGQSADALLAFARDGNTVVVAAPSSSLVGDFVPSLDPPTATPAGRCPDPIAGVEQLFGLAGRFGLDDVDAGFVSSCFGIRTADGSSAAIVRRPIGNGEVVAIAGPEVFTNRYLAEGDNAALATALLAGRGSVSFVTPAPAGAGDKTLVELVPGWFYRVGLQLLMGFALFVWASAPRLGPPVREPLLWPLPSTALATQIGGLYQRSRQPAVAARWLRRRARRQLTSRYRLARDCSVGELAGGRGARTR